MKLVRTPEKRFANLDDYPFKPNYITVGKIRIHYVDEGEKDAKPILLLHGEPTWSYLYRKMITPLVEKGYRVIAPDLVGFGKSDKPTKRSDHTYQRHVDWMHDWLNQMDLKDITIFCQDWGSMIGLRLALRNKELISGIILANGGLVALEEGDEITKDLRNWINFTKYSPVLPIGWVMNLGTYKQPTKEAIRGYKAPFPSRRYKAAARKMPSLIPLKPNDPETIKNLKAWDEYRKWDVPFLTAFSDKDQFTKGAEILFQNRLPGAKNQNHVIVKDAGHFLQEEKPEELVEIILNFIKHNK